MNSYIRYGAGASLLLLMIGLAVFNVQQWIAEGFYILAVVALCAELIGFVMAVMTEIAIRSGRYTAAGVCGLILVVCAGFNVVGAERAWDASMVRHLDSQRRVAQEVLDASRADLQSTLASANAQIASYAHLLPGADTMRARQAGMQAAWDRATLQARANAERAQRELDTLPVTATVEAPFADWQVQIGFLLAEICKALGLWAIGAGASFITAEANRSLRERDERQETPERTEPVNDEVVVTFPSETLREKVIAQRAAGVSYGRIQRELGVPKATAWKWVNAS